MLKNKLLYRLQCVYNIYNAVYAIQNNKKKKINNLVCLNCMFNIFKVQAFTLIIIKKSV